uniref:Integrase catalytic domain-containing protein n=1 Tax=Fagus sylvatica TaxID=28930 RepID=A0A2N9HCZ1_FAGSY
MKDLLIQQGVHKALLGKTKKPEKMSDENWEEMDEKATSAIRLNLGDEMKDGSDLLEQLNAFNMLITQFSNFGLNLEEEDKEILLLASLPTSFNHLVTSAFLSHSKMKQDGDDSQGDGLVVHSELNCSRNKTLQKELKQHLEERKNEKKAAESASVVEEKSDDNEVHGDLLSVLLGNDALSESWVLDFACSYHMCPKKEWFDTYKPCNNTVIMGNDATCSVIGIGTVKIKMFDGVVRVVEDVRHISDLRKNLISLGLLDDLGYSYSSKGGVMKITKHTLLVIEGRKVNQLYRLIGNIVVGGPAVITPKEFNTDNTKLWHMRLGHIGERGMLDLHKRNLLNGVTTCKLNFYKYYVYEKQPRVSFKTGSHTRKAVLDYVHSHVWGPVSVSSHNSAHYFISFIDDYSRKVWIYFLKWKSEVFSVFKKWKAQVENQTDRKIKYLRTGNDLEYRDREFLKFFESKGITHHFTPHQNEVAERMNKALVEKAKCIRLNAELSEVFWAEAVTTTSFIINISPTVDNDFNIRQEVQSGKPIDYSSLKIFGCPAYMHVQSGEHTKLDPKSRKCIFLGFKKGVKGYWFWDPILKKKVISRDVIFDETFMLKQNEAKVCEDSPKEKSTVEVEFDEDNLPSDKDNDEDDSQQQEEPYSIARGRGK